jgi:hypothetical protein
MVELLKAAERHLLFDITHALPAIGEPAFDPLAEVIRSGHKRASTAASAIGEAGPA